MQKSILKNRQNLKSENHLRAVLLKKYYGLLCEFSHQKIQKSRQKYDIMSYNHNIIMMKAFESLKYFAFTLRKNKTFKIVKSLKKWSNNLTVKGFYALRVYAKQQKDKKAKYDAILLERKKIMK